MDALVNLGASNKDFASIATLVLSSYSTTKLKITGASVFVGSRELMTTACYGAGMTLDCLEELYRMGLIEEGDHVVLIGSMGSLTSDVSLGQIVLPNPVLCAYYGYEGLEHHQDIQLMELLSNELRKVGKDPKTYCHGSSFAVFDPHTDHSTYKVSNYDSRVTGIDCGEVFIGLQFARTRKLKAAAALYCSDTPAHRISDIGETEFASRAADNDRLLNRVAALAIHSST